MKINYENISTELLDNAKIALKDNVITQKEYIKLEKIALKDGKLDKNEQLFLASLDNSNLICDMSASSFNPNKMSFNVSEKDVKRPQLLISREKSSAKITELKDIRQISSNQTLSKNLKIGKEVCIYTMNRLSSSNKFDSISNSFKSIKSLIPQTMNRLNYTYFDGVKENTLDKPPSEVKNPGVHYSDVSSISRSAWGFRSGNCGENAALTSIILANKGVSPVETFTIPGHTFTVIGRDPSSDESDPSTWGSTAVIVDAWSSKVFSVDSSIELLKNLDIQKMYDVAK